MGGLLGVEQFPTTPAGCQRAGAFLELTEKDRAAMQQTLDGVCRGKLYYEIKALTDRLERLALNKRVSAAKPPVNTAFVEHCRSF